jgi:hypothetical protein
MELNANPILSPDNVSESLLLCPYCNFDYLHHQEVTVFDRGEDSKSVLETRCNDGKTVSSITQGERNPSCRRDGLSIRFDCEGCGIPAELTIAQHKGRTFVAWREPFDAFKHSVCGRLLGKIGYDNDGLVLYQCVACGIECTEKDDDFDWKRQADDLVAWVDEKFKRDFNGSPISVNTKACGKAINEAKKTIETAGWSVKVEEKNNGERVLTIGIKRSLGLETR